MARKSTPRKGRAILSVVSSQSSGAPREQRRGDEAYQRAVPAADALHMKELVTINIDVTTAVATALRALPAILALRADVLRDLPNFDIRNFDQLETYARATEHADAMRVEPAAAVHTLATLKERCKATASTLHRDAEVLTSRGLLPSLCTFNARGNASELAYDLLALSAMLRNNWEQIATKTAIQLSELDRADELAEELIGAFGKKGQADTVRAYEARQRQRHFTLFVRAYAQVRRAIAYLRWDQNPDKVAPSLYKARRAGMRKGRQTKRGASAGGTEPIVQT